MTKSLTFLGVLKLGHGLTEVNVDATVINQNIVHLEVSVLTVLCFLKLNEGVLQGLLGLVVLDHLAAADGPKAREDHLQVFVCCDGVQLADKQNIVRRSDVSVRKVSHLVGSICVVNVTLSPHA